MMKIAEERKNVMDDPKGILPIAFVSFKTHWGAAVAAQTQVRNPTLWLTKWAPEPRDVYRKKHVAASTPVLLALPVLKMGFQIYCKGRFEPAFTRYPLQVWMQESLVKFYRFVM
ncbi:putative 10TM putative phosphate transporter, cytosolic domain-containing protein [Helianthus anomalus]